MAVVAEAAEAKMKRPAIIGLASVAVLLLAIFAVGSALKPAKDSAYPNILKDSPHSIMLYKTPQCGCCTIYTNYLQGKTSSKVPVTNLQSIDSIHQKYNIPASMWSCHATVIDGYVVEGHIPVEAINKLLSEKPDITGIAMPGMPSGSPGMPGAKSGPFVVYALNKDGSTSEYVRL